MKSVELIIKHQKDKRNLSVIKRKEMHAGSVKRSSVNVGSGYIIGLILKGVNVIAGITND